MAECVITLMKMQRELNEKYSKSKELSILNTKIEDLMIYLEVYENKLVKSKDEYIMNDRCNNCKWFKLETTDNPCKTCEIQVEDKDGKAIVTYSNYEKG